MSFKQGIVAFAFGTPSTIDSNLRIAQIADTWSGLYNGARIYTQEDVPVRRKRSVHTIRQAACTDPPPTLRIARGVVRWALWHRINELWIVCATPHLWRCKRDLAFAIGELGADIDVHVCPEVEREPDGWFCPESTQPRTQSEQAWKRRERILYWMPMFLYTRLAA